MTTLVIKACAAPSHSVQAARDRGATGASGLTTSSTTTGAACRPHGQRRCRPAGAGSCAGCAAGADARAGTELGGPPCLPVSLTREEPAGPLLGCCGKLRLCRSYAANLSCVRADSAIRRPPRGLSPLVRSSHGLMLKKSWLSPSRTRPVKPQLITRPASTQAGVGVVGFRELRPVLSDSRVG